MSAATSVGEMRQTRRQARPTSLHSCHAACSRLQERREVSGQTYQRPIPLLGKATGSEPVMLSPRQDRSKTVCSSKVRAYRAKSLRVSPREPILCHGRVPALACIACCQFAIGPPECHRGTQEDRWRQACHKHLEHLEHLELAHQPVPTCSCSMPLFVSPCFPALWLPERTAGAQCERSMGALKSKGMRREQARCYSLLSLSWPACRQQGQDPGQQTAQGLSQRP